MIHDLHSHTYYSFCGRDDPHAVCEAAIRGGIELLGISDHNYGIGHARYKAYLSELHALREEYRGRLKILVGIEICTLPCPITPPSPDWLLPEGEDLSDFDYCLIEHLDLPDSYLGADLFSLTDRLSTRAGIAHTDLFGFCQARGWDPLRYLSSLAERDIFWEMNVNYDSIHHHRLHPYVIRFLEDEAQQAIVRQSGIALSVGFDSHRAEEYDAERVKRMHAFLEEHGIRRVSFDQ